MARQNLNVDVKIGGKKCKVRKRGCSSSSTSSSLGQSYRLKRALLVGKRGGGLGTPVPVWKMMSLKSPLRENDEALFKYMAVKSGELVKELPISARKLGATLWEIDGLPSSRVNNTNRECLEDKLSEVGVSRKERVMDFSKLGNKTLRVSDPVHSPASERMDPVKKSSHRRRASAGSPKLLTAADGPNAHQNCLVEVNPPPNHARSPCRNISGTKHRLKDVYNGLTTSKELLKLMNRIWRVEQQNSTCLSLVSALKFELDRACTQVQKLIHEQKSDHSEIDVLLKQFDEQKALWKIKEQDKIQNAITSIAGELEIEKKLRRQTERVNKKLGTELSETKACLSKVMEDLENEKRAREIIEQVCDELAQGIGDDKTEVAELKRESEKARQELEKEREMLQLADVLREERVQMKLSEAKYHFEEKNALVDKLKNELEEYLRSKKGEEETGGESPNYEKIKELQKYLRETLPGTHIYEDNIKETVKNDEDEEEQEEDDDDDDDDDDDSVDSDFHSIELNVNDIGKTFQWNGGLKSESKRNSVDKIKGRKSISEKTKKHEISSETNFADGIEWEFTTNKHENSNVVNKRGFFQISSPSWKKDVEDEMERYNMIKNLRDHIVSGSRIASSQDLSGQVSTKNANGLICEG